MSPAPHRPDATRIAAFVTVLTGWFLAGATLLRQRRAAAGVPLGGGGASGMLVLPAYMTGYAVFVSAVMVAATSAPHVSPDIFGFLRPHSAAVRACGLALVVNTAIGVVFAWFTRGKTEEEVCDSLTAYACVCLAVALICLGIAWVLGW